MKYPNTYEGIKKLFTSEILTLASTAVFLVAAVLAAGVSSNDTIETKPALFWALFSLTVIASAFSVIAFSLQFIGLNQARKEDKMFRNAMAFVGVCALSTIITAFWVGVFGNVVACIAVIATLLVNLYIILGVYSIALQLEDNAMLRRCKVTLLVISALFTLTFLTQLISVVIPEISAPLDIACTVLGFVGHIICLIFLSMSKRMLENAKS